MKLGIFSGTFDPVHEGHILFALSTCDQFGLDKVVLVPEKKPRRKEPVASYEQRVQMLELALSNYDNLALFESSADQHTIGTTLEEVQNEFQVEKPTLIMGADVFEFVPTWAPEDRLDALMDRVEFLVALRTEDDGEIVIPLADKIDADAQFVPAPISSISSSLIRSGKKSYLDDDVLKYITENSLYGDLSK